MAANDLAQDAESGPLLTAGSPMDGSPENGEEEGAVMSLVEHLEELRHRLFICCVAILLGSIVGFVFWQQILTLLTLPLPEIANALPHSTSSGQVKLIVTDLGGSFLIALKLALAAGIVLGSPVILYQVGGFITPALTRKERKYAIPFSLLGVGLFVVGIVVGFFVLRYPVDWLIHFGSSRFDFLITADSYLTFVAYFLLAFGLVFELPLVITFLGILGIVNSRFLREKRMYILFGLWILSCFVTPGADPYSPVIIGVAFTILFELSIVLLRILGR
jgi:sec-independent protein translocase protein TatC